MRGALLAVAMGLAADLAVAGELYLSGDLLQARFAGPAVDGTWVQERMPSRDGIPAVKQTKESLAWDVGAGYRFALGQSWYSNRWSIEGGYRHMSSGVSAGGLAVSDEAYGQIMRGSLDTRCLNSAQYEATDHLQGGYLRLAKGLDVGYGIEPYVSGGWFVYHHDVNWWTHYRVGRTYTSHITGIMSGPTVGGGIKYALFRGIKARLGAESQWSITESGFPISSQWLTVGGGIEVPLAFFDSVGGSTRDYLWQR